MEFLARLHRFADTRGDDLAPLTVDPELCTFQGDRDGREFAVLVGVGEAFERDKEVELAWTRTSRVGLEIRNDAERGRLNSLGIAPPPSAVRGTTLKVLPAVLGVAGKRISGEDWVIRLASPSGRDKALIT